jgi:hypothetical protein
VQIQSKIQEREYEDALAIINNFSLQNELEVQGLIETLEILCNKKQEIINDSQEKIKVAKQEKSRNKSIEKLQLLNSHWDLF